MTQLSMKNPIPDTHVLLNVVLIGDETADGAITEAQRALVRRDLTVQTLIDRALGTFAKEKELDLNNTYTLSVKTPSGDRRMLPPDVTLGASGLADGTTVFMGYQIDYKATIRLSATVQEALLHQPAHNPIRLRLRAFNTHNNRSADFTITQAQLPAVIGRRPFDDKLGAAAVDLTALEDAGDRRVSRAHARLIEDNGVIKIEALRDTNPVRVGDRTMVTGIRQTLHTGDIISLGLINLTINVVNP